MPSMEAFQELRQALSYENAFSCKFVSFSCFALNTHFWSKPMQRGSPWCFVMITPVRRHLRSAAIYTLCSTYWIGGIAIYDVRSD